jgi:hypothetical protein
VDLDGVQAAESTSDGLRVRIRDREALASVVAMLVGREVPVYGAIPRTPTLEDVYFAIEAKFRRDRADG